MTVQQFVILARNRTDTEGMASLGRRAEIVERLAAFNTMPERAGEDVLYGPGISIQLPPDADPVQQMLMTITESDIAWQVITRLVHAMDWRLLDPETGRELNAE